MAAPMEVAVCTDSSAQLWSCVVWELHSGANLLTYRGGQAGPRGLALLNGEYLLAAQLGKNYISAWELQRKVRRRTPGPGPRCVLREAPETGRCGPHAPRTAWKGGGVSVRVLCARAGLWAFSEGEGARPWAGGFGEGARAELRAEARRVRGGSRGAGQALAHMNEWGGGGSLRVAVHEWARNLKGEFALELPWVSWAWKVKV